MTDPTEPRPAVPEAEVEAAARVIAREFCEIGEDGWKPFRPEARLALTAAAQVRQAAQSDEVARLQPALATAESAVVTACNMRAAAEARASKAVEVVTPWLKADHVRLHAGEMTAQEMRSVLAVVGAIHRQIAALLTTEATTTQTGGGDARRDALEEAAKVAEAQPYYPDTHTGMRQQWVKDQIAKSIRALAETGKEVGRG